MAEGMKGGSNILFGSRYYSTVYFQDSWFRVFGSWWIFEEGSNKIRGRIILIAFVFFFKFFYFLGSLISILPSEKGLSWGLVLVETPSLFCLIITIVGKKNGLSCNECPINKEHRNSAVFLKLLFLLMQHPWREAKAVSEHINH